MTPILIIGFVIGLFHFEMGQNSSPKYGLILSDLKTKKMIPFIPEKWVEHLWFMSLHIKHHTRCGLWPSYLSVFKEVGDHDDDLGVVLPHHLQKAEKVV